MSIAWRLGGQDLGVLQTKPRGHHAKRNEARLEAPYLTAFDENKGIVF
jgi:hypothetical protein